MKDSISGQAAPPCPSPQKPPFLPPWWPTLLPLLHLPLLLLQTQTPASASAGAASSRTCSETLVRISFDNLVKHAFSSHLAHRRPKVCKGWGPDPHTVVLLVDLQVLLLHQVATAVTITSWKPLLGGNKSENFSWDIFDGPTHSEIGIHSTPKWIITFFFLHLPHTIHPDY